MIDESDKSLFRNTVDKQTPIDKDNYKDNHHNKIKLNKPFENYSYVNRANLTHSMPVSYKKDGLSPKILKKMKQGNIGSTLSIDLHALKIKEACKKLSTFIYDNSDERYIRIIHGKGLHSVDGLSKMKSQIVHYLEQHPQVLAFCSCPQESGGTGAVFVYLKADV